MNDGKRRPPRLREDLDNKRGARKWTSRPARSSEESSEWLSCLLGPADEPGYKGSLDPSHGRHRSSSSRNSSSATDVVLFQCNVEGASEPEDWASEPE